MNVLPLWHAAGGKLLRGVLLGSAGYVLSLIVPFGILWGLARDVISPFPALIYIVAAVQAAFMLLWMGGVVLHRAPRIREIIVTAILCVCTSFLPFVIVLSAAFGD